MGVCISVKFKESGKAYYFDAGSIEVKMGDGVIVETVRGPEYGTVSAPPREASDEETAQYKKLIRIATPDDEKRVRDNAEKAKNAFDACEKKIAEHKLDMKLVEVEYAFDGSKIIFCFTADGRVDFRELVKDLAAMFRTRIELRQIGVRDETKMLGGLGPCGLECCCSSFLADFQPVSIKMAKEQGLSLNPTKISGLCGRLMCCLKYEQSAYEEGRKRLPHIGGKVKTPDGVGTVVEVLPLKETVRVKFVDDDNSVDIKEYGSADIHVVKKAQPKEEETDTEQEQ